MRVYKRVEAISNIFCKLTSYEKCIFINVQGLWICWSSVVSVQELLAQPVCIILLSIVSCLLRLCKKSLFFFGRHILSKQWRWPSDTFLLPLWNSMECSSFPQRKSLTFYNRCGWRQKSVLKTRTHEVACLCPPIERLGRTVFRMVSWKGKEHHRISQFHDINDISYGFLSQRHIESLNVSLRIYTNGFFKSTQIW